MKRTESWDGIWGYGYITEELVGGKNKHDQNTLRHVSNPQRIKIQHRKA